MKPRLGPALALGLLACGKAPAVDIERSARPDQQAPVPLNTASPIQYPPQLFDAHVDGDVVLRLFVDTNGRLVPESSRVAESSGVPAFDSAALAGAPRLQFAPARRRGIAVAASFLEPVEFRHPQPAALLGGPPAHASAQ